MTDASQRSDSCGLSSKITASMPSTRQRTPSVHRNILPSKRTESPHFSLCFCRNHQPHTRTTMQPQTIWYLDYPPSPWYPPTLWRGTVAKETDTNYLLSDSTRRRIPKRRAILTKREAKQKHLAALRKCHTMHKREVTKLSALIKRLS